MSVVALTFSMPPKKSATVVWAYLAHGYRTPVSWEYTSIMSGVTPNRRRARFESARYTRSEEHTSELQSHSDLVCRLLLEKKKETKSGSVRGQDRDLSWPEPGTGTLR